MNDRTTNWEFNRETVEQAVGTNQLVLLEALLLAHNLAADAINRKIKHAEALDVIYRHTDLVLKMVGAKVIQGARDAGHYKG